MSTELSRREPKNDLEVLGPILEVFPLACFSGVIGSKLRGNWEVLTRIIDLRYMALIYNTLKQIVPGFTRALPLTFELEELESGQVQKKTICWIVDHDPYKLSNSIRAWASTSYSHPIGNLAPPKLQLETSWQQESSPMKALQQIDLLRRSIPRKLFDESVRNFLISLGNCGVVEPCEYRVGTNERHPKNCRYCHGLQFYPIGRYMRKQWSPSAWLEMISGLDWMRD